MPGGAHENMRGWSPEEDEMLLQLIEVRAAPLRADHDGHTGALCRLAASLVHSGYFAPCACPAS